MDDGAAPRRSRQISQPRTPPVQPARQAAPIASGAAPRRADAAPASAPPCAPSASAADRAAATAPHAADLSSDPMAQARERLAGLEADFAAERVRTRHRSFQVSGAQGRLRLAGALLVILAVAIVVFRLAWSASLAYHNLELNLDQHRSQGAEQERPDHP